MAKEKVIPTYLYEGFCEEEKKRISEERVIEVGTPCTINIGTDAYPAFVSRISDSGKTVFIKRANYVADKEGGHDYFSNQKWIVTPNNEVKEEAVRKTKRGVWQLNKYMRVFFGHARVYQDPHF